MRVAVVVERFEPGSGGVEGAAFHLVEELARRGCDVSVVCRSCAPPPRGVHVLRVAAPRSWQPLRLWAFSRATAARTASGFDVVHSFSRTRRQDVYRAGGGSHAAYLERLYARPRLQRLSPRHAAILGIEEAVFRDPSQIVQCNARRSADEIAGRYGVPEERLAVIHNGVDTERFHPERRPLVRAETRRALDLEGPVALFVGTGFRRKGLDRAIEGLAEAGGAAVLLVAGADDPGSQRRLAAQRGVEKRVRFLGPRGDVEALHAAADLFVLPTRYDAFSNACLEAMASGLPVATTAENGVAELIRHGENGYVFGADFGPAFALLADPEALRRVGEEARRSAEARSWREHAHEVLALYGRVRERRG